MPNDNLHAQGHSDRPESNDQSRRIDPQVASALRVILEQTNDSRTKRGLSTLIRNLERKDIDRRHLQEAAKDLPRATKLLIETGIETGEWDAVIQCSGELAQAGNDFRKQIWQPLLFMSVLFWMSILLLGGFVIIVVREFADSYYILNTPIRGFTLSLVQSATLSKYKFFNFEVWLWILAGTIFVNIVCLFASNSRWVQRRISVIPGIGNLFRNAVISDFCQRLAMLLQSGIPVSRSIQIAACSVDDLWLEKASESIAFDIQTKELTANKLESAGLPAALCLALSGDRKVDELPELLTGLSEIYSYRCSAVSQYKCALLALGTGFGISLLIGLSIAALLGANVVLLNSLG